MKNFAYLFTLLIFIACKQYDNTLEEHINVKLFPYETGEGFRVNSLPELKPDSRYSAYNGRLTYLLINVPQINTPKKSNTRDSISSFYPDTNRVKALYLKEYLQDKELIEYFRQTTEAIDKPVHKKLKVYSVNQLMEIASYFFYSDHVRPDTSIQTHVCVGLNGVKDANLNSDHTLVAAFCYEAIFASFDDENSELWKSFQLEKTACVQQYKSKFTTLDQYLLDVRQGLFERMRNNSVLRMELMAYFERNQNNLSFRIEPTNG